MTKGVKKHGRKFYARVYVNRKSVYLGLVDSEYIAENRIKSFMDYFKIVPKLGRPKKNNK